MTIRLDPFRNIVNVSWQVVTRRFRLSALAVVIDWEEPQTMGATLSSNRELAIIGTLVLPDQRAWLIDLSDMINGDTEGTITFFMTGTTSVLDGFFYVEVFSEKRVSVDPEVWEYEQLWGSLDKPWENGSSGSMSFQWLIADQELEET